MDFYRKEQKSELKLWNVRLKFGFPHISIRFIEENFRPQ